MPRFRLSALLARTVPLTLALVVGLDSHLTSAKADPATHRSIADLIVAAQTAPYADSLSVLSQRDIDLYREIFQLQEIGEWSAADRRIVEITDPILMGYVKFQRYMHPTAYVSKYTELREWLAYYADHPEADRIYALAIKRRPAGATGPRRHISRKWRQKTETDLHPLLQADYEAKSESRVRQIEGRVRYLIHNSRALDGLDYIRAPRQRNDITQRQFDRMKSWVAASLYYQGYADRAKKLAGEAADRNGETAVLAYWIDGLIAFREGDPGRAYRRFQAMANVSYQDNDLRAGAAFWAARMGLAAGLTDRVYDNLNLAAQFPFTFYGQLALAQLGRSYDYDWSTPAITAVAFDRLSEKVPGVRRAVALAEVGKTTEADLELRWANGLVTSDDARELVAVAAALDLPAAQIDIALLQPGESFAADRYPLPDYAPLRGFKTDRALLYALMRQESKFKTEATSRVGARGLMQLMPRTASFIGRDRSLQYASGRDRLYDPSFNLELGQKYVNHLLDTAADGNILHMAVAYNGGPGNLRRWSRQMEIEDPLLFIESIPNTESRNFAERVLTNLWVYRARLGQPAPTRDRIAAGELPIFEAIDALTADLRP